MSTLKRDRKKKAQAKHMRRTGQKQVRATKAETRAYIGYARSMGIAPFAS